MKLTILEKRGLGGVAVKFIPGFEGRYVITRDGQVYSEI